MDTDCGHELVVCLHGLGRTRHCWWLLRRRMERAGYRTSAWTYPLWRPIEWLGCDCLDRLAAFDRDPAVSRIHVVTHSLGGIILRQALMLADTGETPVPRKLGRVIMIAPPNRGSAWARRLGPWLGWLAPALPQLSDAPDSLVNRLGPCGTRFGLCGTGFQPVWVAVIAAAKDGKCPLPTTHLPGPTPDQPGETTHIVVPGRHTFPMHRRDVAGAILRILREPGPPAAPESLPPPASSR